MVGAKSSPLVIWMNGDLVGYWQLRSGVDELQYTEEWVANPRGRPLSLSLPFTPGNQKLRGPVVSYYFENLLPDSRQIRERIARKFELSTANTFDLLAEVGRDCVGAIQILPYGKQPKNVQQISCTPLTDAEVAAKLNRALSGNAFGYSGEVDEFRVSLAGAQEKTAFLWHDGQWSEPQGATPTTHIFKLPMGLVGNIQVNMQASVENEWLCSNIVRAYGLPIAHCDMADFNGNKVLIVERFDRKLAADGSWILRLPQEDFCQASGLSPLQKYQSDGGPSIDDCVKLLGQSVNASNDIHQFYKAQLVFWVLAATDGHAKNFSIKHLPRGQFELAPLYDVLSMHPIVGNKSNQLPKQKLKMAMAIKGSRNYYQVAKIQRRHFIQHGLRIGLSEASVHSMIEDIVESTDDVINKVSCMFPADFPAHVSEKIFSGMRKQASILQ